MTITRTSLADEIDIHDQGIADLNSGKRDCFDAYRDQCIAAGMSKASVKLEIEAVKGAIKRRRAVAKDEFAVEEKDARLDEVFAEITASRTTRHAHVENIEEFAAEEAAHETMGGLPVPAASETAERTGRTAAYATMGSHGTPHGSGVTGGESAATSFRPAIEMNGPSLPDDKRHSRDGEMQGARTLGANAEGERRPQRQEGNAVREGQAGNGLALAPQGVTAGETATHSEMDGGAIAAVKGQARPASVVDAEPSPSFVLPPAKSLRPFCQNREQCSSGTRDHCWSCKKIMAANEVAA